MKTLILSILFAACLPAQGIFFNTNMPVSGGGFVFLSDVSNTQAVISYTAPSSSACTVEVSESPSYSPLVHDVDATLFPGDNSDSRSTSIVNGTSRMVVIGARKAALASDANYYSRALQTNTTHYFRIVCGGSTYTGAFRTANIPLGNTNNETYPASSVTPGLAVLPTITGSRSQQIIDPQTGALLSPVSLSGDQTGYQSGSRGVDLYDGAAHPVCNEDPVSDGHGAMGYICNLDIDVGYTQVYYIVTATGEKRNLGWVPKTRGVLMNDGWEHYIEGGVVYKMPYTGGFADVGSTYVLGDINTGGATTPVGSSVVYSSTPIATLIQNFDPTFDPTYYPCPEDYYAPAGKYTSATCKRADQGSHGWIFIFYGGDGRDVPASCAPGDLQCPRVVAAWNTYSGNANTRFNNLHQVNIWYDDGSGTPIIGINWGGWEDFGDTRVGYSVVATTTTTSVLAGTSTITLAGDPTSRATGGDPSTTMAIQVGDAIKIRGIDRTFFVGSIVGHAHTLTEALPSDVPSGTDVFMPGNVRGGSDGTWAITLWKFLDDPHGSVVTNTYIKTDRLYPGGGHYFVHHPELNSGVLSGGLRASESGGGWAVYPAGSQKIMDSIGSVGIEIPSTGCFNGVCPPGFGSLLTKHPTSWQRSITPWFADRVAFGGGLVSITGGQYFSANPGATLISGSLYQYFYDTGWPLTLRTRKIVPTQATTGGKVLRDLSGPTTGNTIGTSSGDNYTYCVAHKANECRTGSAAGDIYFNVPSLPTTHCTGGDSPNPSNIDICITNAPTYSGTMMQLYADAATGDLALAKSRNLSGGLHNSPKSDLGYPVYKSVPDEAYGLYTLGNPIVGEQVNVWMVKQTPMTPSTDGIDRSKFVPKAVNLTAPTGLGVTRAAVRFGYLENGTLSQYYCTTRREACVAASATAPLADGSADPFWFEGSDTFTGVSCATTCTVTIPVLPVHIAYYQPIYYNAAGTIVATGNVGIVGDYIQ